MDLEMMKKSHKKIGIFWSFSHLVLRLIALITSAVSARIVFKNHQTTFIEDFETSVKYSDDVNFKFFAYANTVVASFSVVAFIFSLFVACMKSINKTVFFCFFINDVIMVTLMGVACGVASAVGYEAKYGNTKAGWLPICYMFRKYCELTSISLAISYFCLFTYLFLSILSAQKSR